MAGGGVTLFKLGEHLDWLSLTLCMIGLIVFTIAFEVGLHNLEHRIKVRSIGWWLRTAVCMCRGHALLLAHPGVPHTPLFVTVRLTGGRVYSQGTAWTKMLSKVYKELMILGFISFVLLMINQFINLPTTQLLMFELSHVWIFLVAVFFVVHAIIFMLLVRKVKRHWDATAHMEVPDLLQQYVARARTFGGVHGACVVNAYAGAACPLPRYGNTTFWRLPSLWYDLFGRGKLREEMGFHIAKSLFLRVHNLPANFDFAKYLRRSLTQHITDQIDVKVSVALRARCSLAAPDTWCCCRRVPGLS